MARPERFELPTYGFVVQGAILHRSENFWLYLSCQPDTRNGFCLVL